MCWRHRLLTIGLVFAIVFPFTAEDSWAQGMPGMGGLGGMGGARRRQPQQQQQQQLDQQIQTLPSVQTTGTVEAVVPGWIKVLSTANQLWVFQVMPSAKCQVTGKAKPDALCAGCYVRFIAPVNKRKGTVDDPVGKLLVFTPSQFRQVGADPDTGFGSNFGERPGTDKTAKKADEKAKPAFGAVAAAGADADRKSAAPGSETFDIRGQVTGFSGGKLWLYVPTEHFRPKIRVEVADNADIDVELDDPMGYTVARKGDKIRVTGRQRMTNQGFATDLDILLGEPLGASQTPDKKGHAKGRGKKGAEAEEPAAGDKKGEKKDADAPAGAKKPKDKDEKDGGKDADAKKAKPKDKDADTDADAAEPKSTKKADARKTRSPAKKPAKDADSESSEDPDKK
jgi:hypothetical protein